MRIVYLLTQDLASPSGLGRYLPIAKHLALRGHEVRISALHPDYQRLKERRFSVDGVSVHYVAPMHVRKEGSLKHYYNPLKLFSVSMQATQRLCVDAWQSRDAIVHVGKPHPMNGIAGLVGSLRNPGNLCVDCDDYETASMYFSAAWQKLLVAQFEKSIPRSAKLVTVNTQFMRDKLVSWGVQEQKIVYIPNGVDPERFQKPDAKQIENLRQSLNLTGKQVVAYIGSMSLPSHPVDLLLRAFQLLVKERSDIALLLVGGGGDYTALQDTAIEMGLGDLVRFTGRIEPNQVSLYYQLADVTVDPVYDNDAARGRSPLKLFESWASGIPLITSRVGDRENLIQESQAGLLTEDCTPEAYAHSIRKILTSASLAEHLRTRGLIEVSNYTWEKLTLKLEQAYRDKLKSTRDHVAEI